MKLTITFLLLMVSMIACQNFDPFEDVETHTLTLGVYNQVTSNVFEDTTSTHHTPSEARNFETSEMNLVLIEETFQGEIIATFTVDRINKTLEIKGSTSPRFVNAVYNITSINGGSKNRHLHLDNDSIYYRFDYVE